MKDNFVITGTIRCGSTAFAKILNTATNAEVFVEQKPQLHEECRYLYEKRLSTPKKTLYGLKIQFMNETNDKGLIWGDKCSNYVPFIPYLQEKIILLIRDGTEVVRSMIGWHQHYRNIYPEAVDSCLPLKSDSWDYSRPRPLHGDSYVEKWKEMNRFEMCTWYWCKWNNLALDLLSKKPKEQFMIVKIEEADWKRIEEIFEFLNLEGFDRRKIHKMINSRINSLQTKFGEANQFPIPSEWNDNLTETFWSMARETMERTGYV